jgi:predicted transcriptional regulator
MRLSFRRIILMRVLLSIKPKYAERIFDGEKRYEFRKVIFKNTSVSSAVVYVTQPVGLIMGEFEIQDILCYPVDDLWELTKEYAGISRRVFYDYFRQKQVGYAIQIGKVYRYPKPLPLTETPLRKAPQSFSYIL